MKLHEFLFYFIMSFALIIAVFAVIDSLTIKQIGTERIKCPAGDRLVYEDIWCEKKIVCSKYGFVSNKCGSRSK